MNLTIIAAMTPLRVIASTTQDGMLWRNRAELEFFKSQTLGKKCLVGRKTAEQMPILKGRDVYVLSKKRYIPPVDNYHAIHSISDIPVSGGEEVMVIGGANVYELVMPYADKAIISTIIDSPTGDIYMPNFVGTWQQTKRESFCTDGFTVNFYEKV